MSKGVDLNLRLYCKDCKDPIPNIVENFAAGDMICGNCGLVLGNRIIDTRSEWRTFSNSDEGNDDPSRVGGVSNPLLEQKLESTNISRRDGGSGTSKALNRTMNKVQDEKSEKQIKAVFNEIQSMADRIGLTKVISDTAKQLYKKAEDKRAKGNKSLRGKKQDPIIAACFYIACKQHKVPRTLHEISSLTKVPKKDIGRCYKLLKEILITQDSKDSNEEIDINEFMMADSGNAKIKSYIERFGNQLNMEQSICKYARTVAQNANREGTLGGKSPITLVAACLYFVSHMSKNQKTSKEVAEVCGCTESTMKSAYRQLYEHRDKITSPEIPIEAWFSP
ncbi:cyclin-like protein [Piromyces finnis]|uniref:Transcription initiation factor IIB n=1 Tax=Piromyces finnis TaxID=1754191 RepID=A0A1Y1VIC7_9FUNG|nr:cyclin-like protein [Piromyces finnis]|eukprot:ORX57155.1 cyclin-like protein [Piromyces finnis]